MAITLLFTLILLQTIAQAQNSPHGLSYETPIAFSPSAFQFFHPGVTLPHQRRHNNHAPAQAPMLLEQAFGGAVTGKARADEAVGTGWIGKLGPVKRRLGAGGVSGIVVGVGFFVGLVFAAVYVVVKRRDNVKRAKGEVMPDDLA
ncbi:hypothetical protein LUZ60_014897 [Juncus effusus]|nr:hypothetical protein LUZ60_014897 [Juncus effusus]